MGRIKDRNELKGRRGPGRKARKQADPSLPVFAGLEEGLGVKQGRVGGKIKQRARRRARLLAAAKAAREEMILQKSRKHKTAQMSTDKSPNSCVADVAHSAAYSDENRTWLKPIIKSPGSTTGNAKKKVTIVQALLSDGNSSEEGIVFKRTLLVMYMHVCIPSIQTYFVLD